MKRLPVKTKLIVAAVLMWCGQFWFLYALLYSHKMDHKLPLAIEALVVGVAGAVALTWLAFVIPKSYREE